jgi:hypothetical protein
MNGLTTGHFVLYAVLIVVTMTVLDWLESKRIRIARARQDRREQLDRRPAKKAA